MNKIPALVQGGGALSYLSLSLTQVKIYSTSYLESVDFSCLIITLIWQESIDLLWS